MLKLYKRNSDGKLEYHEAWVHGEEVTSHWGIAGERGESETYRKSDDAATDEQVLNEVLQASISQGFRPLDEEDWSYLIVEYQLESWGDGGDLDKRHRIEDRMNQTLGWTGLGNCDGGSIGSGTMEVCCLVADYNIAKRVVEQDLKDSEFADYSRIYNQAE